METWKTIKDYPNYAVSNGGRIKRLLGYHCLKERILKTNGKNIQGYSVIDLCKGGVYKCVTIHKLVLEAFVSKRPDGMECNHKDGIKTNSKLRNLEWITHSKNMLHAVSTGLLKNVRGEKSGRSKLTNKQVRKIRDLYKSGNYSQRNLAKMFNIGLRTVCTIINRLTWRHV